MIINRTDEARLSDYWLDNTTRLNNEIDYQFKSAQDHAYELGFNRQKKQSDELLAALKEIADETYDQWSNGAKAKEIALAAIEKAEATS